MKLSVLRLLYRTSALLLPGERLTPKLHFAMCRRIVGLSLRFNPHTQRYLRPLRRVLEPHFDSDRVRDIAERHLVYRRYFDNLPILWSQRKPLGRSSFRIDGEEHLAAAVAAGTGAALLSSHAFGANLLVPPILSELGYPISLVGGWDEKATRRLWGEAEQRKWKKIYLGDDSWSRMRGGKQIVAALGENTIVFLSMFNRLTGGSETEINVFGQKFYIDSAVLRFFEHLNVGVLPCFALCDDRGRIEIILHPPLSGTIAEMSRAYCKLFTHHLTQNPEFCRFWKPLTQKKTHW